MLRLFALLIALLPGAALAQNALLDPQEFGEAAVGQTYWFSEDGFHYGAEQFFEDQTTIWQDREGLCKKGRWWAEGDGMCFVYEDDPTPHCWVMWETEDGRVLVESLRTLQDPDDRVLVLELIRRTPLPVSCTGPLLGV